MNKHADDYVFGMDKDIQDKMRAKFDPEKQAQAQAWVEAVTGIQFEAGFQESLKDGVKLCKLLNTIKPDSVPKINETKMAFKQRENIVNYLEGCKKLGMRETDCFVTQDLFEGDNLIAVIDQLFTLGAWSRKVDGFAGPYIGNKLAEENKRDFTAEQLADARKAVPLANSGSVAVEKSKGTDAIVMYGKVGQDMGKSSNEVSQQMTGGIAVEKNKGTDAIVKYGKVGQEMGVCTDEPTNQTAGAIQIEKNKNLDQINRSGTTN